MSIRKQIFLIIGIIAALVALDQFSKAIIRDQLSVGEAIPNHDAFFRIVHTMNDGVAFSMLRGSGNGLIIMQSFLVLVIIALLVYFCHKNISKLATISLSLMLGGGIGNLIDRLRFGWVTDFISAGNFPVFNIADSGLTIGCALMLIYVIRQERKSSKKEKDG